MKTAKVYPLHPPEGWTETGWADLSHEFDFSPFPLEHDLGYWEVLHELIDSEPRTTVIATNTASSQPSESPRGGRSTPTSG